MSPRPTTARSRLVAALTAEILSKNRQTSFPISSEHQLCRRFNVSRVTVRLALSDLENRGIIYRKHGKGTFAHGRSTLPHRAVGILMRSAQSAEHRPIAEMIRGAVTAMAPLRSAVLLITMPPGEWLPEMACSLGGVIVVPQGVTEADLATLQDRHLPYYIFTESELPGAHIRLNQREAARRRTEELLKLGHRRIALLTGYDSCLDYPKRLGVHDALRQAGLDPAKTPEFSARGEEGRFFEAARDLLRQRPRPTAVIAFDDSLGSIVSFQARRQEGIQVPGELSIVSFHDWPYLNFVEPALTTARFEFFTAGQRAAEALSHASLTGDALPELFFEPTYRDGQTVGPVPRKAGKG